jgi:hypothetical protein
MIPVEIHAGKILTGFSKATWLNLSGSEGRTMKQSIIIPIDVFNDLLKSCAESQPEYQTLKNGFIMRNKQGGEEVHIPYEASAAREILALANRVCPQVVPRMSAEF